MILCNLIAMIFRALSFDDAVNVTEAARSFCAAWDSLLFLGCKYPAVKYKEILLAYSLNERA